MGPKTWRLSILRAATHETERGTMTSVSAGHIILIPNQPVGSGRPQQESNPGSPHEESCALLTELPPLFCTVCFILWDTNMDNLYRIICSVMLLFFGGDFFYYQGFEKSINTYEEFVRCSCFSKMMWKSLDISQSSSCASLKSFAFSLSSGHVSVLDLSDPVEEKFNIVEDIELVW